MGAAGLADQQDADAILQGDAAADKILATGDQTTPLAGLSGWDDNGLTCGIMAVARCVDAEMDAFTAIAEREHGVIA